MRMFEDNVIKSQNVTANKDTADPSLCFDTEGEPDNDDDADDDDDCCDVVSREEDESDRNRI